MAAAQRTLVVCASLLLLTSPITTQSKHDNGPNYPNDGALRNTLSFNDHQANDDEQTSKLQKVQIILSDTDLKTINIKQDWKLKGLESASLHFEAADQSSQRDNCPQDCKCGLITGVTCYSPSSNAVLPNNFPPDIQVLSVFGYKNITDELHNLSELQELSIYDGELVNFPTLPSSLTHLRITNSKLKNVEKIENLPYLQTLNVAHNNLTDIDLSFLEHLLGLDLSHNPLEKVPSLPSSLTTLKMKSNYFNKQPTTWDVYLPNLRRLMLTRLHATQPPYLSLPKLEYLDLSHSDIKLLPYLAGLPSLREINLSHIHVYHAIPGHFEGASNLKKVDLSFTRLSKLPDKLFINNPNLKELYLHNSDIEYIKDYTFSGLRNLVKLVLRDSPQLKHIDDKSLSTLDSLKILDISQTPVKALPYSINHVNLTSLIMKDVTILCDCHSHWLPKYLKRVENEINSKGLFPLTCRDGELRSPGKLEEHIQDLDCVSPDIISPPDVTLRRGAGKTALLECNSTGLPSPIIIWHSPDKKYYTYNQTDIQPWFSDKFKYMLAHVTDATSDPPLDPRIQPLKSGQLLIQNFTRGDVGLYRCTAVNEVASVTSTTSLWLTVDELEAFKFETLLFGLACAMTFLLTTLIVQLIRYIMDRMGWECCCCRGRLSSKAMQVKKLLESVETYKSQQLDKLKENYNSQVVTIKESCYQQMEKLSEGYTSQCKNLQNIKDYSAQQITTARDQYVDQINRCRDYSVGQMNKVSENYVFQRQRIRKFSAHQLFKLRETYKYQQKTLNKILENIPDLYLQNCRTGGNCNRTDSMIFDDEIHGIDAYYRLDFFNPIIASAEGSEDFYYTPSSTLTKAQRQHIVEQHRRQHSNCSTTVSNNDFHEAVQSWATNTPTLSPGSSPSHPFHNPIKHTRSLSISSTPKTNSNSKSYVPTHRRALSANINLIPPVKIHRSSPPLVEKTYWTPLTKGQINIDTLVKTKTRLLEDEGRVSRRSDCDNLDSVTRDQYNSNGELVQKNSKDSSQLLSNNYKHYTSLPMESRDTSEIDRVKVSKNNYKNNKNEKVKKHSAIKNGENQSPGSEKNTKSVSSSDNSQSIDSEIDSEHLKPTRAKSSDKINETPEASNSVAVASIDPKTTSEEAAEAAAAAAAAAAASSSSEPSSPTSAREARKKSISREGSKEMEARCALPSVTEDKEPSLASSETNF